MYHAEHFVFRNSRLSLHCCELHVQPWLFGMQYVSHCVCVLLALQVMTPEEWHRSAQVEGSVSSDSSTIQGQALTQFMEHRLAGFYHTLCNLIWGGDMCHTQFQWYCDDPDNRREMLTFIYRNNDLIMFSNVTVAETPHQVPVSFMAGTPDSLLWRCPSDPCICFCLLPAPSAMCVFALL